MLLNLKIFKICIMHEFTPQKVKICKHAREKYDYLESLSYKTSTVKRGYFAPMGVTLRQNFKMTHLISNNYNIQNGTKLSWQTLTGCWRMLAECFDTRNPWSPVIYYRVMCCWSVMPGFWNVRYGIHWLK